MVWKKYFRKFISEVSLLRQICLVVCCISLFSCSGEDEVYTYDKTGFTPTRYVPYTRPSYRAPYQAPYSRVYQNPYEIYHPNPYYPTYYDQDYYYVPPNRYRNVEPDYGIDQKS